VTEPTWWTQATQQQAGSNRPGVARRRRGWSALLVLLALLGLVLVAADRAADLVAERAIARGVQRQQGLSQQPQVSIGGFPFLTQAVSGRFQQVDLAAAQVPAGDGLTVDRLQVRLTGLTARGSDVITGRTDSLTADRMTLRALVGYPTLDDVVADRLQSDQVAVSFGDGGRGRLAVSGTIGTPLGDRSVQGLMQIRLVDGGVRLRLDPKSVDGLTPAEGELLARVLNLTIVGPEQIGGVRPTAVEVGPSGVTLTASAADFPLTSLR
jgi:hypothetical protein